MADSKKVRSISELKKIPENQLTAEEKLLVFGPGNPATMLYRQVERDGQQVIVSRMFQPGDEIPEGWESSPTAFGLETEPQSGPQGVDGYDGVVGMAPAAKAAPAATKAKK